MIIKSFYFENQALSGMQDPESFVQIKKATLPTGGVA
jgi:hypothetical protein